MRKISLGVAAVLAGCLAVVVLVSVQLPATRIGLWTDKTDDSGRTFGDFPRKLAWRVLLPEAESGEIQRRVFVDEKGFALQEIIEFTNGDTGLILYAADGSFDAYRFDSTVHLPEPVTVVPTTGRISYRKVARGGRQSLEEINYRKDGTVSSSGLLLPTGEYRLEKFSGDAVGLMERSYFDNGKKTRHEWFFENGQCQRVWWKVDAITTRLDYFYPGGRNAGYHIWTGNMETAQYLWEDGFTPRMHFEKKMEWRGFVSYQIVEARYFGRDGKLDHRRFFEYDQMRVEFVAKSTSPLFSQVWAVKNKGANLELKTFFDEKNLRLASVSIAGNADRFAVQYFFADDGTTVTELRFKSTHNGAVVLVREVVKSGKIAAVAVRDYDGKLLKSTRFEKDVGKKVQVADALKRNHPFEFPDTRIAKPAAGAV